MALIELDLAHAYRPNPRADEGSMDAPAATPRDVDSAPVDLAVAITAFNSMRTIQRTLESVRGLARTASSSSRCHASRPIRSPAAPTMPTHR